MYQAAVGHGWVTRTEFWQMAPIELWWLLEAKKPPKDYAGMSEYEVAELYEETYG